jgi:hypothetical protein
MDASTGIPCATEPGAGLHRATRRHAMRVSTPAGAQQARGTPGAYGQCLLPNMARRAARSRTRACDGAVRRHARRTAALAIPQRTRGAAAARQRGAPERR